MAERPIKPDVMTVLKVCVGNDDACDAFARIVAVYLATKERAERAEAELTKLKAEIHAAVQAAPDAMADNEGKV